ncbi:hypothetical protein [Cognataquiflexum aquatile]|uniref:hypothetical protein n=1 Tax=Cognataquiflexum aquatile TaxID=2249427 RepID=UPI000DE9DA79|nr:hypothetical protein [Cognataquiflexum aquatile]
MSKFLWIISRNNLPVETEKRILSICEELAPTNIIPNEPIIHLSDYVAFGISNPKNNVNIQSNSLLVGALIGNYENWYQPNTDHPDGSYALFREDSSHAEIISDPAASRTIWYYFEENLLIASTSQLAIVRYLGNFEINHDVIPWMLSSGTLGPFLSWDKRLQRIMPDCSIILNKRDWILEKKTKQIVFKEGKGGDLDQENQLKKTLQKIFENLKLNYANWILPLSGGYDSRALLYYFKELKNEKIKSVTWGKQDALNDPNNDAYIAKILAMEALIGHTYFQTNFSNEDVDELINKFVKNGEGRIDSISGYLDGFKIWEDLHREKVQGIFRGDVGWTSDRKIHTYFSARKAVGLTFISDYSNLQNFSKNRPINQTLPDYLMNYPGENPEIWRDRLYHSFRIPTVLASLADLKLGYVEQVNPLLSRDLLELIRKQPTRLRKDKKLFKKIVDSMFPSIPFAKNSALEPVNNFLHYPYIKDYLRENLDVLKENEIFDKNYINRVIENILDKNNSGPKNKNNLILKFKRIIFPPTIKLYLKKIFQKKSDVKRTEMDYHLIAFRILLILKTFELFDKKPTTNP